MIFEKLLFFAILIYCFACGIQFLRGKTSIIGKGLYRVILGDDLKGNGFYRKVVGVSLICLAVFGFTVIILLYLHSGLTKIDHIFINTCFVIEGLDVLYLNKVHYKYATKK